MQTSSNLHEKIQEIMKIKFNPKKHYEMEKPPPYKKHNSTSLMPKQIQQSKIRRNQLLQEEELENQDKYSENRLYNSVLLNKASDIIKLQQINRKKQKTIQISPNSLQYQKIIIESILSKFEQIPQESLLMLAQKRMNDKIQSVQKQNSNKTNIQKLPIISQSNSILIVQRKKVLYDWNSDEFKFQQDQKTSIEDQMEMFIKEIDKQKLRNENFKIKINNEIDKIERLKNTSYYQKKLGQLCQMQSSYNFHDIFLRYRQMNNHLNIQKI